MPLEPRVPGQVGIYACGPTVYGRIHVGNARPFVVFSLLKRFLEHEGYATTLVANVTDINDKIYVAAREQGVGSAELAENMTAAYMADTEGLGLGRPDAEPLATESVPEIIALIEALVERGHAYAAGGDVYFRVRSHPPYGELSHRDIDQMDQGEGIEGADRKEDALDFALWKANKPDEDTSWDSPWGPGRPGWHIECSAMAEQRLGLDFEIHGGGADLLFPHHENEAAQTLAGRGKPLARLWMHNGMIELGAGGDAKMSKSIGNIVALHEALVAVGRDTLIMYFSGGHYRRPMPWRDDVLEAATARVKTFREAGRRLVAGPSPAELEVHRDAFFAALADDFNTPEALAAAHAWVNEANRRERVGDAHLREMLGVLGLENLLDSGASAPPELVALAEEREAARAARDFATADRLRDELRAAGWEVRDGPSGPDLVPVA
ncbi:MAG: cysteinyl-tRNA synthetase [Solirubrobacteraceae bacterium]|nr:cysteinyl-tRNA synthetase [Solirubrobacteraceae bacterium]